MFRTGFCIAASAVLVGALIGCNPDSSASNGGGPSAGPQKQEPPLPPPEPLFEGWTTPAAAIVLSGQQHGYLEPCGCSETQSGGLARRDDLFRQIAERDWPATAFDLGGTIKRNREQSKYKFETYLAALNDMQYAALSLGPEELRLSDAAAYLISKKFDLEAGEGPLSLVCANVRLFDDPASSPAPSKTVTAGGLTIAVTSIVGSGLAEQEFPAGANNSISILDPADVLPDVLAEVKQQSPDLIVLLSHADLDESRRLAKKFPDFDVVVSAGGMEDPAGRPERIGRTMLVTIGRKGKHAGVVGIFPDEDERLQFELVNLDNRRFQDSPRMKQHMQFYQDRLRDFHAELIADLGQNVHPSGQTYLGAAECGRCHTKAYSKWKTSRHSHAYESLKIGRKGQEDGWISRIYDPECLACHVTGWAPQAVLRYESGFLSEELSRQRNQPELFTALQGQQCENCHGPGSRHVELEDLWKKDRDKVELEDVQAARKQMHLSAAEAERKVCYRCHDLDNSPHFAFKEYWEKVKHPWRD